MSINQGNTKSKFSINSVVFDDITAFIKCVLDNDPAVNYLCFECFVTNCYRKGRKWKPYAIFTILVLNVLIVNLKYSQLVK
ncbi:hypothetical protein SAMN05192574_104105 [Mucilaginibacter gossypiicola]|uniref:Uncharacterized protein n=1 Tax=Mucilaginibacter gossypiicola TaxID=551995 RepID=A0A1H8JA14_9SPHI|nr:hypothetical protein SAMN05192574_104105 [Mucilaginibacter gossypiicola]